MNSPVENAVESTLAAAVSLRQRDGRVKTFAACAAELAAMHRCASGMESWLQRWVDFLLQRKLLPSKEIHGSVLLNGCVQTLRFISANFEQMFQYVFGDCNHSIAVTNACELLPMTKREREREFSSNGDHILREPACSYEIW